MHSWHQLIQRWYSYWPLYFVIVLVRFDLPSRCFNWCRLLTSHYVVLDWHITACVSHRTSCSSIYESVCLVYGCHESSGKLLTDGALCLGKSSRLIYIDLSNKAQAFIALLRDPGDLDQARLKPTASDSKAHRLSSTRASYQWSLSQQFDE